MARNPSEAHTTVLCRAAQPRGPAEAAEPWEPTLWSHRERLSPPPPTGPAGTASLHRLPHFREFSNTASLHAAAPERSW